MKDSFTSKAEYLCRKYNLQSIMALFQSYKALMVLEQFFLPQGMELWFRLPAEAESGCSSAALDTKLGLSCGRQDLSEFPTLEEGLLPSAEASPGAPASVSLLGMFQVPAAAQLIFYCSIDP